VACWCVESAEGPPCAIADMAIPAPAPPNPEVARDILYLFLLVQVLYDMAVVMSVQMRSGIQSALL